MAFDEGDEISLGVAVQRGLAEIRVLGQEAIGADLEIGEIAAAAAGDPDFLADLAGMIEQQDLLAALARGQGAHQAGRAGPDNDDVERRRCCRHSPLVPVPPPV